MKFSSIILRAVPFILTFAAGLLIASIFVPISSPGFRDKSRFESYRKHERNKRSDCRRARSENEELKYKNQMLQTQNEELRRALDLKGVEFGDIGEFDAPLPPPPPMAPVRNVKMRSVPLDR